MSEPHHDHHHDHHVAFDDPETAARTELEGDALIDRVVQGTARAEHALAGQPVRQILDIGSGPGVASCHLAERFPEAEVHALDGSPAMLERARARAEAKGVTIRIAVVELPGGLSRRGPADLVWASMVLHHVGDEAGALAAIRGTLRPGGVLALLEAAGGLRVYPPGDDLGRPGIWDRLDNAWQEWFRGMRHEIGNGDADYPALLDSAGFDLVDDEVLHIERPPPLDDGARRFALDHLNRTQKGLAGYADSADLEALAPLTAGDGSGLAILGSYRLFLCRAR